MARDLSTIEVETSGGVVYEVEVPATVAERLPQEGQALELRTVQVTREDSVALYGFLEGYERELFRRLLTATGVGAKLALSMLSTFSAQRLAQALATKDLAALSQVSGVGKKTAERLALELSEKVKDLAVTAEASSEMPSGVEAALAALVALGFSQSAAEAAIREAVKEAGDLSTEELIRKALSSR